MNFVVIPLLRDRGCDINIQSKDLIIWNFFMPLEFEKIEDVKAIR
jgi:hypothetical protein